MTTDKKRGLGRSLQDLLSPSDWLNTRDIQLFYCAVDRIVPNPLQPRLVMDDAQMQDLVQSVKQLGIIQPILVTQHSIPDQYQIVAGERRWKAAKAAGLDQVPVILRDTTSHEALQLALIENIQRRDLTCLEEALAYQRLQEEFKLTQDDIATSVGKSRSSVANLIRLLQLPSDIQEDILNERLTMGHSRALLSLPDSDTQRKFRDIILSRHLSVRQTEQLINKQRDTPKPSPPQDPHLLQVQSTLGSLLGANVILQQQGNRRTLRISFQSEEPFKRLLTLLGIQD